MVVTREDYKKLDEELAKAGAPRPFKLVQPHNLHPRRRADRERHGASAARRLRRRFERGEFGRRELRRRLAQAWAST